MFNEFTFLSRNQITTIVSQLYSTFKALAIDVRKTPGSLVEKDYFSTLVDLIESLVKGECDLEFISSLYPFSLRQLHLFLDGVFFFCMTKKLKEANGVSKNKHWLGYPNIISCVVDKRLNDYDVEITNRYDYIKRHDILLAMLAHLFNVDKSVFDKSSLVANFRECFHKIECDLNFIIGVRRPNLKLQKILNGNFCFNELIRKIFDISYKKQFLNCYETYKKYADILKPSIVSKPHLSDEKLTPISSNNRRKSVRFKNSAPESINDAEEECINVYELSDNMEKEISEFCNAFHPCTSAELITDYMESSSEINQFCTSNRKSIISRMKVSVCKCNIYELADFGKSGKLRKKSLTRSWSNENLGEIQCPLNKQSLRADQNHRYKFDNS